MSLIGAGIMAGASLLGGGMSMAGQSSANRTNAYLFNQASIRNQREARAARQFGEHEAKKAFKRDLYMSNTAHRRQMYDLEQAGLNPLLALGQGASGGSNNAPSGGQATSPTATMENTMEAIPAAAMEAARISLDRKKQEQEIKNMKEQRSNLKKQGANINADTIKKSMETQVLKKSLPEAEVKNDVYDVIRPYIKKLKEAAGSNSKFQKKILNPNNY